MNYYLNTMRPKGYFSLIVVGASLLTCLYLLWNKKNNRSKRQRKGCDKPPSKWRRVGEVKGLMVYPLKSGRGIPVLKAECAQLSLVDVKNPKLHLRDREYIVYDEAKKTAVTGLINPRIVLMEICSEGEEAVKFSFPEEEDFFLQVPIATGKVVIINRWWGETVSAVDCGEVAAKWFSQSLLKKPSGLRLGFFSQPTVAVRSVQNGWTEFAKVYKKLCSEYLGAYSYMASYLIITEESVHEVNSRLMEPVSEQNYRANIVVRGSPAYSEDFWDWLRIGPSVILQGFKPCTRCAVTAINPDTGKLDPKLEPLRTLKRYRQTVAPEERALAGSEPVFGVYAGLHTPGTVQVGDSVYVGIQ